MSADRSNDVFEVFDPWTGEPDPPPAGTTEVVAPPAAPALPSPTDASKQTTADSPPAAPRRKRRRPRPPVRPPPVARRPDRALHDPAGFLRSEAIPLIQAVRRRLEAAGHHSAVQDLLDLPTPALRFLLWPRPGPLADQGARILLTLELTVGEVERDLLAARYWLGPRPAPGSVEHLGTVITAQLTPSWIESQVLSFVQEALQRA